MREVGWQRMDFLEAGVKYSGVEEQKLLIMLCINLFVNIFIIERVLKHPNNLFNRLFPPINTLK